MLVKLYICQKCIFGNLADLGKLKELRMQNESSVVRHGVHNKTTELKKKKKISV